MISLIVILFHFSYLWFRHLLRVYGLDGSKWPWHRRHLRLGPFERTVELLKLARPRTKPVEPECCADEGLHRHFEGRGLEWPYMLLFKGLGHLWEEFWTMMHKQPRYFLNMQRLSIYIIFVFCNKYNDCNSFELQLYTLIILYWRSSQPMVKCYNIH